MRTIFLLLPLFVLAPCVCQPSQAQSPALNRPSGAAPTGPIPSGLPALARKYQAIAKSWRPDATLVRIDIRDNFADPQKHIFRYNTYSVVLNFYSAAANSFQAWAIGPDGDSFEKPARLHETKELNLQFVDLPQAVAAAKAAGFIDNLRTASLTYAETEPSTTREAWDFQVLTGRNGPRELVLADTGKALRVAPCNGKCDTGPQIAARETSNFGAGLVLNTYLPEGVTELKPIGWTWQRQVTEIHPVQAGGFGVNPYAVGKQNAPTQYQTDYLCTNVVQGPTGYFFLTGKGTGIPQDCVLYQNAQYEAHRKGNALGIHATLPRRSGGTQSLFIGTGWTIQPYDKAKCTSLKIDVCP